MDWIYTEDKILLNVSQITGFRKFEDNIRCFIGNNSFKIVSFDSNEYKDFNDKIEQKINEIYKEIIKQLTFDTNIKFLNALDLKRGIGHLV